MCMELPESITHVLRDCKYAKLFWTKLGVPQPLLHSFSLPFLDWLKANAINAFRSNHLGIPWEVLFPMGLWLLWLQRNAFIFRIGVVEPNLVGACVKKGAELFAYGLGSKIAPCKEIVQVAWKRPPLGWTTLNTDGLAMGNPGKAGCGGLLRNSEGSWIKGFARGVGCTTSCVAELWALRDGLNLASSLGIESLIIQLDALAIVHLLNNFVANLALEPLLSDCRNLLRTFPRTRIEHVYREANQCADALAKLGAKFSAMFIYFDIPPDVVVNLLTLDRAATSCNRLIAVIG